MRITANYNDSQVIYYSDVAPRVGEDIWFEIISPKILMLRVTYLRHNTFKMNGGDFRSGNIVLDCDVINLEGDSK